MRAEQAAWDVLPGHPLARHIDDFLTDLAGTNKPRNTIRAYRRDLGRIRDLGVDLQRNRNAR